MKRIFLSPGISSGQKIKYLFCVQEQWLAISEEEYQVYYQKRKFDSNNLLDFEIISDSELFLRIPQLKNKLEYEKDKFITIDYENGQVFINPMHKLKSIFTDTSARATNQANFEPDTWTYIKNRKVYYLKIIFYALLIFLAAYMISWALLIMLFWFLFFTYFSTLASLDNYNMGTLNAAFVVTKKPTRIAVYTDASMGFGKYPLVRICKMRLPKKYRKLNERIPVSCGYQVTEDQNFWDYIQPNPLVYASNDAELIQQKINEIPLKDWLNLKKWISQNSKNFYEGYYPIRNEQNNWEEYEEPKFTSFFEEERPEKK